jgi:hypothetical protein
MQTKKTIPAQFVGDTDKVISVFRSPQVGEIVLFTANPDDSIAHSNYNKDEIPAIITRVWSDVCVNVKIIPDCGAMQDRTSVVHYTANPAGYHFRYKDEQKSISTPVTNSPDSMDASSFLNSNKEDKLS